MAIRSRGGFVAAAGVVAALIVVAVVALVGLDAGGSGPSTTPAAVGGTSATAPSSAPARRPSEQPGPSSSPVAQTSAVPSATARSAPRKAITYRVKRGDNLTVIAAWFKLRGYGDLYERNKDVIGADPDLIRPGQRITVSPAGVTMSR